MIQPFEAIVNKSFKVLINVYTEKTGEHTEIEENIDKWSISQQHVITTQGHGRHNTVKLIGVR